MPPKTSISPRNVHQNWRRYLAAGCFFVFLCCLATPGAAAEKFPLYPCIRPNVQFWENVYSHYTSRQGILHDRERLHRVYAVVDLVDRELPGAALVNESRIKAEKDRVVAILTGLGKGKAPSTREEKRIAALFGAKKPVMYREAAENIRVQIGQKDRFYEGVIRSGKYLTQFKQIFAARGLPQELAYLPHVESSFNTRARSKAGAAGLWQFTGSTGREYMAVNELVDERYDPQIAAGAAADLLKGNYDLLKAWPLAITAYNCGRTGMYRALQEKGSYEKIFQSYTGGSFGFAARNFYPEFLAALRTAKRLHADPKVRGLLHKPETTKTLRLKEDTHISRLRSAYKVSHDDFVRLNPALLSPVTEGKKNIPRSYLVRLPAGSPELKKYAGTRQAKNKNTVSQPKTKSQVRAAQGRTAAAPLLYTVRKGDTLLGLARSFNTSSGAILAANGRKGHEVLKAGEHLIIPAQRAATGSAAQNSRPKIKGKIQ